MNWYDYGARHYDAALGRWHAKDPSSEKYYGVSPYTYCINNPAKLIDINGEDSYEYNVATRQLTWINDVGGSKKQTIDFVKDNKFINSAEVNGENAYVYALKDAFVVTNFDAHFDDQGYNAISGYEYSLDDFKMRNEILKDPNPIGSYILESERNHVAEPITRRDAEMTYGHSLMGLMTLSRAMDTALNLVDTGAGSTRKMKGYSSSQTLLRTTPSGQNTKNSWNLFLKANKGKYRGPNWEKRAKNDYFNSSYYKRK